MSETVDNGFVQAAITSLNFQSVLVFLVMFLLITAVFTLNRKTTICYPPGPPPLPLLGNLPMLRKDMRESVRKLTLQYGDVMTIYMGTKPTVILSSHEAIKEAFITKGNSISKRPENPIIETYMTRGWGVVQTNGELWQEHRRFTLSVLRDFGMGKAMLEDRITGETHHLLNKLQQTAGQPYNPRIILNMAVANVIHSILFGDRWDYDDPDMYFHMETFDQSFKVVATSGLLNLFPFLIHLPFDLLGFWKVMARIRKTKLLERQRVEEHRKTYDPNVTRDFIDAYLHEIKKREHLTDSFHDDQMLGVVGDLFGAGTETTATTLRWAIAYMVCYPEVQRKVQAEIDEIIGRNRLPCMHDRLHMPYTDATLLEIQRVGSIVPFGVPHETTEEVTLQGHTIPSGTLIFSNLYAVHMDPKLWSNPKDFNPERFLSANRAKDGHLNQKQNLIPFSVGKRACMGEALARMELFLFFTTMLQRMHFSKPPVGLLPSLKGVIGITYDPEPFEIIATPRN